MKPQYFIRSHKHCTAPCANKVAWSCTETHPLRGGNALSGGGGGGGGGGGDPTTLTYTSENGTIEVSSEAYCIFAEGLHGTGQPQSQQETNSSFSNTVNIAGLHDGAVCTFPGAVLASSGTLTMNYLGNELTHTNLPIEFVKLNFYVKTEGLTGSNGSMVLKWRFNSESPTAARTLETITTNVDSLVTPRTFDITSEMVDYAKINDIRPMIEVSAGAGELSVLHSMDAIERETNGGACDYSGGAGAIPTPDIWLDMSDPSTLMTNTGGTERVVNADDSIRRINDQPESGGNDHFFAASPFFWIYKPNSINGLSSAQTDAVQLSHPQSGVITELHTQLTVFVVFKSTENNFRKVHFSTSSTGGTGNKELSIFENAQVQVQRTNGTLVTIGPSNHVNATVILSVVLDGTSTIAYRNGVEVGNTTQVGTTKINQYRLNFNTTGPSEPINYCEYIVWYRALTADERNQVARTLGNKWGVTV